jgi:hypothetical protein
MSDLAYCTMVLCANSITYKSTTQTHCHVIIVEILVHPAGYKSRTYWQEFTVSNVELIDAFELCESSSDEQFSNCKFAQVFEYKCYSYHVFLGLVTLSRRQKYTVMIVDISPKIRLKSRRR